MTLIINNQEVNSCSPWRTPLRRWNKDTCSSRPERRSAARASTSAYPPATRRRNYQWGTMEGGSTAGYFAIRMKSDIIYETEYKGVVTQEKYCMRPGPLLRPDSTRPRSRTASRWPSSMTAICSTCGSAPTAASA